MEIPQKDRLRRSIQAQKGGKTALVLAGGGLTGAVYEIGALRAIDDLLVDRTVNDFDIYVGTSAGALVGACLANGLSPQVLMQTLDGSHPAIQPMALQHIFSFNRDEFLRLGLKLPANLLKTWTRYLSKLKERSLFDLLWSLAESLPSGLYDGSALEQYVAEVLAEQGLNNHFTDLDHDLFVIATDLDSGERVLFSRYDNSDVPISQAVAASSAVPLVYKPVQIGDRFYVDGSLRGNVSIDLAIEQGADLVICLNPLVPYQNQKPSLSQKGGRAIASQVIRNMLHAGLHYHIKQLERLHPDVDIILIEPQLNDSQMFSHNMMRYAARLTVAHHGFESVTLALAENYRHYKQILARHGIPLSRRLVIEELTEIRNANYDPAIIRAILEARSAGSARHDNHMVSELTRTLAELDWMLEMQEAEAA